MTFENLIYMLLGAFAMTAIGFAYQGCITYVKEKKKNTKNDKKVRENV